MSFFNDWASGRAIRESTLFAVRYALPLMGALFLITAIVYAAGGPCLLPGSIACSF